jgi:hypothetical protein
MNTTLASIEHFAALIPSSLSAESGKVFYSGRAAFSAPAPLYILGVNPGGAPENYTAETVRNHTDQVLTTLPDDWSAYRDEVWENAKPGTYGMAPRVLHLFSKLRLQPGHVPASNLHFVRSRREEHIKDRQSALADLCWPFHAAVIAALQPRAVLCLGATAGNYVRQKLGANRLVSTFVEQNNRRWKSQVFSGPAGPKVVIATHPSIADWTSPPTDPSSLMRQALE